MICLTKVINNMTGKMCREMGIPPAFFSQHDYNIMISLPELKSLYLSNSANLFKDKEFEKLDSRAPLLHKNSRGSRNLNPSEGKLAPFLRQTTNRSSASFKLNDDNAGRLGSLQDGFIDDSKIGFDLESKGFILQYKLPFNLLKILEEFSYIHSLDQQSRAVDKSFA